MSSMVIIELLTTGGTWIRYCDGSSHPSSVTNMLKCALKYLSYGDDRSSLAESIVQDEKLNAKEFNFRMKMYCQWLKHHFVKAARSLVSS